MVIDAEKKTFKQPLKTLHFKLKINVSEMLEIRFLTVVVLLGPYIKGCNKKSIRSNLCQDFQNQVYKFT